MKKQRWNSKLEFFSLIEIKDQKTSWQNKQFSTMLMEENEN